MRTSPSGSRSSVPSGREPAADDRDDRVHEEHREERERHRDQQRRAPTRGSRDRARHRSTVSVHCSIHSSRWLPISRRRQRAAGSAATSANFVNTGGQRRAVAHREHEHLQRDVGLELLATSMKSTSLRAAAAVLGALEHAGELDLAEARVEHGADGRRLRLRLREVHRGRRARRVRDHERVRALVGALREVAVVRLSQPSTTFTSLARSLRPVVAPAVVAVRGDRREQEREPGRRRRRVLDHEQALVRGLGEVVERRRHRELLLREPLLVVVDAHVAVVDRREAVRRVELVLVGHRRRAPAARTARRCRRRARG